MWFLKYTIVFLCFLLSACSSRPSHSLNANDLQQQALQKAQTYLLLGQWQDAKEQLNQISPQAQGLKYWRLNGLYWLSVEPQGRAVEVHQMALLKYPKDAFLLNNYGTLLGAKGHWRVACESFEKARQSGSSLGQSVWINLARCALRQKDVNFATIYIKQAKEIADLPFIGLMTELNLALIQGNIMSARHILKNIQANNKNAHTAVHFDEFHCLSRQVSVRETDLTRYSSASPDACLNNSRY